MLFCLNMITRDWPQEKSNIVINSSINVNINDTF